MSTTGSVGCDADAAALLKRLRFAAGDARVPRTGVAPRVAGPAAGAFGGQLQGLRDEALIFAIEKETDLAKRFQSLVPLVSSALDVAF
jgi:hypothetical protein